MPAPSLDLIRGVPLFAGAPDDFLERLSGEFFERTYRAGDAIARRARAARRSS